MFTTHYTIKKQLEQLNESITYNVEREIDAGASYKNVLNTGKVSVGAKKKKTRMIADEREIEKELQDILNNVQKIPMFMARPEFVFIFDELDKVSPEFLNREEFTSGSEKETMFAQNSIRDRQAVIMKLLSNMKYFLSTANAKFIFIAGREMYDMYLADIADRSNYFGSIFNDVILVPSLLSDDKRHITALTEEFVCHYLIPENHPTAKWNLKTYKQYISKYFGTDDEGNRKIQKIIATLQQFIIYLSHTSKGTPKKMKQVFESFIEYLEPCDLENKKCVAKQYDNSHYFLSFNYYEQFTIGITSYLVSPVINLLMDANIKERSDKLLVSTLHFVDYMLKFHSQNFTWRQLDISPEVIETNHPPELKSIINDVVTLYEQIHFTKPIIGLFDFKFDNLFSQEISSISKIDENFSAQFSFSLDESLALKQHYSNLLRKKQLEYKESILYGTTFVSSISSLQIVLGDLHFLDDELDEAAIYYKDSLYLLRKKLDDDKENLENFYLLIRNQLKLAYLYEKRKQPEFAYLLYGEMVKSIIEVRDLKNVYFKSSQITPEAQSIMLKNMSFESLQLFYLPLLAKLQILEKRSFIGILEHDIKLIEEEFNSLIHDIKHKEIKILTADFYSKVGDILYYKNKIFSGEHIDKVPEGIEISHYACHYYKKALIALVLEESDKKEKFYPKTIMQILKERAIFIHEKTSSKYCNVMARVLSDLGDVYFSAFSAKEKMCNGCEFELTECSIKSCNKAKNKQQYFWENWHKLLHSEIKLNDFLDNCASEENPFDCIELALFLYSLSIKFYKKANLYKQSAFQAMKILDCFKFCVKINKHKEDINSFDYSNIAKMAIEFLYLANDGFDMFEILKRKVDFDEKAKLQYIQVDSEINKILTLQKELELYLSEGKKRTDKLKELYGNYIISPYCINYSVSARVYQLNLKAKLNWETYKIIKKDVNIDDKEDINTKDNIQAILTKGKCNGIWGSDKCEAHKIFSDENEIKELQNSPNKLFALLEFLVADSIFCYTDMLRLMKTSNDSYVFNHRFFAETYRRLAKWTNIYEVIKDIRYDNGNNINDEIKKHLKENMKIDSYLEKFLEKDFRERVSAHYYRQMAFLHYHKSKETHIGGRAYFNLLEQMYFIRGDYDDVVSHFNMATERFMINHTEKYKVYLDKLKEINTRSSLHDVDNYFEKQNSPPPPKENIP